MATSKRELNEKRATLLRERAEKYTVEKLSLLSGLSPRTLMYFRQGEVPRPSTLDKVEAALASLKKRKGKVSLGDMATKLAISSGSWQGQTTVKEITGGRYCGWCGGRHDDCFQCQE